MNTSASPLERISFGSNRFILFIMPKLQINMSGHLLKISEHFLQKWFSNLTLNMRGLGYFGLTRSISWLLMLWFLASPGHQEPWYWLWKIGKSWSYTRKNFNIYGMSVWRNDIKYKYMLMFPLQNLARKELLYWIISNQVTFQCIWTSNKSTNFSMQERL